ncbi:MAG: bifunctional adenosylcobinamide kinase/adenosylcobinamide-phosphate guanylyltransferase [Propionibacteriaceae bacterium]|nr:bifunctional adenosylcobinamide kinase/adenosylcobinamide-phosphate guanylyltransferase [Propionibacteriaceae bacterium]
MMTLVIGPNQSGKSATAERLARQWQADPVQPRGGLIYVATMIPANPDGRRRVTAHQRGRSGAGFITLESPLADLAHTHPGFVEASDIVLLEDVSNLLANLRFTAALTAATEVAWERIVWLRDTSRHLIAVTIGGLDPALTVDRETARYINDLNRLNQRLAELADDVIQLTTASPSQPSGQRQLGRVPV